MGMSAPSLHREATDSSKKTGCKVVVVPVMLTCLKGEVAMLPKVFLKSRSTVHTLQNHSAVS